MAQIINLAIAHPDRRQEIATAIRDLAEGSYQTGRVTEAVDMTRLLLRAFPDCWDTCSSLAWNFTRDDRRAQDPAMARQAIIWEEATAPMRHNGDYTANWLGDVRNGGANVLVQIGDLETSIAFHRLAQWAYFDVQHQAYMWLYLGQRFLDGGYQDRAAQYFKRLLALDSGTPIEPWIFNQARDYMALLRGLKNTSRPLAMSFDSVLALRLAERSIEDKDYQRAISGFQQAMASGTGQVVPVGGGRFQGLAMWCAERMRNFPQEGIDAYRASQGAAAAQALAQAASRDDLDAMERMVGMYPISEQAVDALIWLTKCYAARGADVLVAATIQRLVTDFSLAESVQSQLLSVALRSSAKSGQRRMFAELAAEFVKIANPVVDGVKVDAKVWVKEAGVPLVAEEPDHKAVAAIGVASLTMLPEQLRDIRRFVKDGARTVHMVPRAGVGSGMAYVHTGIDGVLMDLATGTVRWRTENSRDADRLLSDGGFTGMPDAGSIISGNRCVTRVRRDGRWCLEARDLTTGKVAWSSAGIPELSGMNACSSPASDGVRVLALFNSTSSQLAAVAVRLSDGHLSWHTALPISAGVGGLFSISESGFNLAAPTISGRDAYIVNEGGSVLAIDAASGFVRWVSSYANAWGNVYLGGRTAIERLSRPVSQVVVQNNRLYVLPKDTLGLLCLSQTDGTALWRCDFPYGRALVGVAMTRGGERIVLQGNDVRGFDAVTGRLVWQWKPLDGATIGVGTMNGASVTVATALSLNRLSTETGALLESTPWKTLGITGSAPGNLQWANDRLIACGNGGIAILAPSGKPAANLPALVPSLSRGERQVLPTIGLKPIASGAPLALLWRMECAPIVYINRPDDGPAGELMLLTQGSLSRLDTTVPAMVWSTPMASDVRRTIVDRDSVLVIGNSTLTMLGREDGAVRWCEPYQQDMYALFSNDYRPEVSLAQNSLMVYTQGWQNYVEIRDRKNGKRIRTMIVSEAGIYAVSEINGKICIVFHRKGKVWTEMYELSSGEFISSSEVPISPNGLRAQIMPGGEKIILFGSSTRVVDVATGASQELPTSFTNVVIPRRSGTLFELWTGGDGNGAFWSLWDPAANTFMYQEKISPGWFDWNNNAYIIGAYRLAGDNLVRVTVKDEKVGILCKTKDGKDKWWAPFGANQWSRVYLQIAGNNSHIYALYAEGGEHKLDVLDAANGKLVASSRLPGWGSQVARGSHLLNDTWVIAGENQLIAVAPAQPEQLAQLKVDDSVPPEQRYLRGLMRMPGAGAISVMPLAAAHSTLTDPATIVRWKTIAPIDNADWKAFVKPPFDPAQVDLSKKIGELSWIEPAKTSYAPGWLDLTTAYPGTQNCAYFCYADINSLDEVKGILSMGADDALIVWLNGEKIYEDKEFRGVTPNSLKIPMTLKKGRNALVCGIHNGGGPGGIQCQVVTLTKVEQTATTTWATDWAKLPALLLGPSAVCKGAPAEAQAHFAYDATAVYVAVAVKDRTPFVRPPGTSPLDGDGVILGIDGRDDGRASAMVIALHDPDGIPKVDVMFGTWAADPELEGRPVLRVLRGSGRQVYLLAIPWALLRRDPAARPGNRRQLDLGMAVIDRSATGDLGIRAWGAGLIEGFSPRSWPTVELLPGQ